MQSLTVLASNTASSWVACDARSNYVWKIQVYTGKVSKVVSPEINLDTRVVLQVTEELRPLSSLPWCPRCPREMLACCCTTAEGPKYACRHPPLQCQQIQLAATYSCCRMAACWLSSTISSTCWCKMPSSCDEKSTRNEWRASDTSVGCFSRCWARHS